jgi:hypothetical protein
MVKVEDVLLDDLPISEWPDAALGAYAASGNAEAEVELRSRYDLRG